MNFLSTYAIYSLKFSKILYIEIITDFYRCCSIFTSDVIPNCQLFQEQMGEPIKNIGVETIHPWDKAMNINRTGQNN